MTSDSFLGFSGERFDAASLLDEAIRVATSVDEPLGSEGTEEGIESRTVKLLRTMKEEVASFPPRLGNVVPLRKADFIKYDLDPPQHVAKLMQKYDFYYAGIPVTLFPKAGWAFTRLECQVSLGPVSLPLHKGFRTLSFLDQAFLYP